MIHQKPEQDSESLSPRERFNAVMALVPSVVKERAMKRFIEKYWEFLGIFFACDAPLCKKQTELLRQSDSIMSECRKLHKRLVEKREKRNRQTYRAMYWLRKPRFLSKSCRI